MEPSYSAAVAERDLGCLWLPNRTIATNPRKQDSQVGWVMTQPTIHEVNDDVFSSYPLPDAL